MLNVDIKEEIADFTFNSAKWSEDKLIASSPFRYDRSPSFFLNLDGEYAGTWGDSGYYDIEYKSGNFIKLLAFLREETYEETEEYLIEKYDYEMNYDAKIVINFPKLDKRKPIVEVPKETYEGKPLDSEYLIGRGIHPKIIEFHGIFDAGRSVGIPWRGLDGKVLNIKYRAKNGKVFWFEKNATPISRLIFGIDKVVERGITEVVVCEAEIDALTWQSTGIYAVAVGGVSFNEKQAQMLLQAGVRTVKLAGDHDKAGYRFNQRVEEVLGGRMNVKHLQYHTFQNKKDANDLGVEGLKSVEFNAKRRGLSAYFTTLPGRKD